MNCPTYVLITDKKPEYSHDHCGLTAPQDMGIISAWLPDWYT